MFTINKKSESVINPISLVNVPSKYNRKNITLAVVLNEVANFYKAAFGYYGLEWEAVSMEEMFMRGFGNDPAMLLDENGMDRSLTSEFFCSIGDSLENHLIAACKKYNTGFEKLDVGSLSACYSGMIHDAIDHPRLGGFNNSSRAHMIDILNEHLADITCAALIVELAWACRQDNIEIGADAISEVLPSFGADLTVVNNLLCHAYRNQ